jgi:hypothetical protein
MKTTLLVLALTTATLGLGAPAASAQTFQNPGSWNRPHHHGGWQHGPRVFPRHTYGGPRCFERVTRHYNQWRGTWVVRRAQICR